MNMIPTMRLLQAGLIRGLIRGLIPGLYRGLVLSLFWWILAEGRADSWAVGIPSMGLALVASLYLSPPGNSPFNIVGLFNFIGFFLLQSIKAGIQVARMTLQPRLDLSPALLEFKLTLPEGMARVFLVNTLNLLPGTLSVRIEHDVLRMHVLDQSQPIEQELRTTERCIARMLGQKI
jgi:multicomponent Na+:H+ antiporter subunit E